MFSKVLIANRGEIALRVIRACREMGIQSVAVHSTADADAMHVRMADESVCIGPPPSAQSYLSIPAIISACEITGAEAIHPGYGFLSENANFVQVVEDHDLTFIGPSAAHIRMMGDKITAKDTMKRLGVPCVPGSDGGVATVEDALALGDEIGYPLIVKASAGGGGRGMKIITADAQLVPGWITARSEAQAAFGCPDVYIEKYLADPRHIEIQVVADSHGNVVHLGERECSIQRRHQKLVEEAPSVAIDATRREELGQLAVRAARAIGYQSTGTLEFLMDRDGHCYFMEMNTRIQVEHTVTEEVTGFDLVHEQLQIAAGRPLSFDQGAVELRSHAIECRINAEDPRSFAPSPGRITALHLPGGFGVRVDGAIYEQYVVPPHYDSLLAKLVVRAKSRPSAIRRLRRALSEFVIEGINTNLDLYRRLVDFPDFEEGRLDTGFMERLEQAEKGQQYR